MAQRSTGRCRNSPGALAALLHIAAAQILFLDVPDHAAVNLAVAQAGGDRRTGRARGLVNGVLRQLVRNRECRRCTSAAARKSTRHAGFSIAGANAYGEAMAEKIAVAHLELPPLDLSAKDDARLWAERLGGVLLPTGSIRISGARRVPDLAGFDEGAWWVQDAAAALPAKLLGEVAGKERR